MKNIFFCILFTVLISACDNESDVPSDSPQLSPDTSISDAKPERTGNSDLAKELKVFKKRIDGGIYPDYDLYGFKNTQGEVIIEPKYDYAQRFVRNTTIVAVIKEDGKFGKRTKDNFNWGLIDNSDSMLITPVYNKLKRISSEKFVGLGDSGSFIFNSAGDTLKRLLHNEEQDWDHNDSLLLVRNSLNRTYGLMDKKYNYIIEPKYSFIGEASKNRIMVLNRIARQNYIGYTNLLGNEIIPPQFIGAGNFKDSTALVLDVHGKEHMIDNTGKLLSTINQSFIDSIVTSNFESSDFKGFTTCHSKLKYPNSIYTALTDCSQFLFGKHYFYKNYQICPQGYTCSSTVTYAIFDQAYFKSRTRYEGFPEIEIYLAGIEMEEAKIWNESFMNSFEYQLKNSANDSTPLIFSHKNPRFSEDAEITIVCDSTYCKIQPYIDLNY